MPQYPVPYLSAWVFYSYPTHLISNKSPTHTLSPPLQNVFSHPRPSLTHPPTPLNLPPTPLNLSPTHLASPAIPFNPSPPNLTSHPLHLPPTKLHLSFPSICHPPSFTPTYITFHPLPSATHLASPPISFNLPPTQPHLPFLSCGHVPPVDGPAP